MYMFQVSFCLNAIDEVSDVQSLDKEWVPLLIRTHRFHLSMTSTLGTANLLKEITGVDPGWDATYTKRYSGTDQEKVEMEKKIQAWETWYAETSETTTD